MNRLRYTTFGGNAVEAEDFEWLQNATKESFKLLMKAHGVGNNEYMILFGCDEATPGNITAGAVVIDGEPMAVDAQALPALTGSDIHYFSVVEVADPSGNEPLESGGTTDQYIIRKAVVVAGTPSGSYLALNGKRYYSEEDWHYVGYPGEIGYDNGANSIYGVPTPVQPLAVPGMRFRKTKDNRLELGGRVNIPVASYGVPFATLPASHRPDCVIQVPIIFYDPALSGDTIKAGRLSINASSLGGTLVKNGEVSIQNSAGVAIGSTTSIVVYLDGILVPLER